jgi:hypothetical protein
MHVFTFSIDDIHVDMQVWHGSFGATQWIDLRRAVLEGPSQRGRGDEVHRQLQI